MLPNVYGQSRMQSNTKLVTKTIQVHSIFEIQITAKMFWTCTNILQHNAEHYWNGGKYLQNE